MIWRAFQIDRPDPLANFARTLAAPYDGSRGRLAVFDTFRGFTANCPARTRRWHAINRKAGQGVRLTPAGERLVGHAERVFSTLEEARADMAKLESEIA